MTPQPKIRLLPPGPVQEDWMEHAACLGANPDVFFPERGGSSQAAKRICATCTVRGECEDFGIEIRAGSGVWGGKVFNKGRPKDAS